MKLKWILLLFFLCAGTALPLSVEHRGYVDDEQGTWPVGSQKSYLFDRNGSDILKLTPFPDDLEEPQINIRSYSGSPLLLEIVITDPDSIIETVVIEAASAETADTIVSRFVYHKEQESDKSLFDIKLTPIQKPGVYDLLLIIKTEKGVLQRSFTLGFVDFIWGRDNFRYANIGETPGTYTFFSELLFDWGQDRFGNLEDKDKVIMLYDLYRLFGDRTGRCYAFSGSQVRYRRFPELLPSYYPSIYSIRKFNRVIQIEKDYYQKDIVFHHFIHKGINPSADQTFEELRQEVDHIITHMHEGYPVVTGYLGKEEHHSMVVYGFIKDNEQQVITLVTANNWRDEADVNVFSEDAENVVIDLKKDEDKVPIKWFDRNGRSRGKPEKIFTVDIKKKYEHDRSTFDDYMQKNQAQLAALQESILVVEQAGDIYLENSDGQKSGFIGYRVIQQIEEIEITKIDQNFTFRLPAAEEYSLYITPLECDEKENKNKVCDAHEITLFWLSPGVEKEEEFTAAMHFNFQLKCETTLAASIAEGELTLPEMQP